MACAARRHSARVGVGARGRLDAAQPAHARAGLRGASQSFGPRGQGRGDRARPPHAGRKGSDDMSRISTTFARLREDAGSHAGPALVAYVTAGDPDLTTSCAIVRALARGGADVIEIGVP